MATNNYTFAADALIDESNTTGITVRGSFTLKTFNPGDNQITSIIITEVLGNANFNAIKNIDFMATANNATMNNFNFDNNNTITTGVYFTTLNNGGLIWALEFDSDNNFSLRDGGVH